MEPPRHSQEPARLAALRALDILDTAPERDFDDAVALAARICDTPMALVSLVDAERQWFKAETGLGESETPRGSSICAHAILQPDGWLEIADTTADPRTADNPLVCGAPDLRFYAGATLLGPEGLPLGTLCVLDRTRRVLTAPQREGLRILARQVSRQLELRAALRREAALRAEMDHRVKNSLQAVGSLIRIQARMAGAEARAALERAEARISASVVGGAML